MKERPILMSSPNPRRIISGEKTQTRRILKGDRGADRIRYVSNIEMVPTADQLKERYTGWVAEVDALGSLLLPIATPYVCGDRLWVKETWHTEKRYDRTIGGAFPSPGLAPRDLPKSAVIWYADDGKPEAWGRGRNRHVPGKGRPSIFMMRHMSRLTLEITAVRVERLQQITGEDALAEGVEVPPVDHSVVEDPRTLEWERYNAARGAYSALWESINGPGSWAANPWVWAVTFKRVSQ